MQYDIILLQLLCRHPEFFYPRKFVSIKSEEVHLDTSTLSTIWHGTHLKQIKEICAVPKIAAFIGKEKQWRFGYSLPFCSYIVDEEPKPIKRHKPCPFGPFLWFGTAKDEVNDYGPYCFEFHLKNVLQKYRQSRGNKRLCYRAGGTLMYKQEITYVVIICCEDDKDYQSYPLIEATSTKYFKPPITFGKSETESMEPSKCKKPKIEPCNNVSSQSPYYVTEDGTLFYQRLPLQEFSVPALVTRYTENDWNRHGHVALAFYLPHGIKLELTNQDGELYEVDHLNRCIKTKGKDKTCRFPQFERSFMDNFNNPD